MALLKGSETVFKVFESGIFVKPKEFKALTPKQML